MCCIYRAAGQFATVLAACSVLPLPLPDKRDKKSRLRKVKRRDKKSRLRLAEAVEDEGVFEGVFFEAVETAAGAGMACAHIGF